jgi:hypothetical protein
MKIRIFLSGMVREKDDYRESLNLGLTITVSQLLFTEINKK